MSQLPNGAQIRTPPSRTSEHSLRMGGGREITFFYIRLSDEDRRADVYDIATIMNLATDLHRVKTGDISHIGIVSPNFLHRPLHMMISLGTS